MSVLRLFFVFVCSPTVLPLVCVCSSSAVRFFPPPSTTAHCPLSTVQAVTVAMNPPPAALQPNRRDAPVRTERRHGPTWLPAEQRIWSVGYAAPRHKRLTRATASRLSLCAATRTPAGLEPGCMVFYWDRRHAGLTHIETVSYARRDTER